MVSVVVAAYNTEKYIAKCLGSLQKQTYTDFEVIVVVDGATDKTFDICEAFSKQDSRFVTVYRKNGGLAAARNTGLERCTAEYVTFVDSDDYVSSDYLENLVNAIKTNNCDISACGYILEDENGNEKYRTGRQNERMNHEMFLNHMLIPINRSYGAFVWNKLYKNKIIQKHTIRFPDEKKYLFEDHYFNYVYMKYAKSGCYTSSCAYHYITRENTGIIRGITENNRAAEKWFRYADVFDLIIHDSYNGFDEFKQQIKMMKVWHSSTAVRVLAYYGKKDAPEYRNMRRYIKDNMLAYLKTPYIGAKKKIGMLLTYFMPKLAFRVWSFR